MSVDWLVERIASFEDRPALMGHDGCHTYQQVAGSVLDWRRRLSHLGVDPGAVVAVCGDYSPEVCSLLIALLTARAIVVPLGGAAGRTIDRQLDVAGVSHVFSFVGEEGLGTPPESRR